MMTSSYRVWVGVEGRSLKRGPICESLDEALGRAYRLAPRYAVRVGLGNRGWHVFSENKSTIIGPGFRRGPLTTTNSSVSPSKRSSALPRNSARVSPINTTRAPLRNTDTGSERRRGQRVSSPLLFVDGLRASLRGDPIRVVDISWIGARLEFGPKSSVQVGEVLELQLDGPATAVTMAGCVKWTRRGECGVAFVQSSMGLDSATLLERILAAA